MTETFAPFPTRTDTAAARRAAFLPCLILLAGFLVVSVAMEALLLTLGTTGTAVDIAIWIRCTLVLGSALILLLFAISAFRGSRPAWVRIRIISPIVVVAVVVIVSIPGFLPDWVRVEQAICGALVLPVAILVNRPLMRAVFPKGV